MIDFLSVTRTDDVGPLKKASTVDLKQTSEDGRTLLHFAAMGNTKALKFLLKKKSISVDETDLLGRTALHYAARSANFPGMKLLRKNGANVKARDNNEAGFFHFLCQAPHFGDESIPIFELASKNNFVPCSLTLDGNTPTHYAAESGNIFAIRQLFDIFPFPLGLVNNDGNSCLHLAVKGGHTEVVEFLYDIEKVYVANKKGELPVDIAFSSNNQELLDILADEESLLEPEIWGLVRDGDEEALMKVLTGKMTIVDPEKRRIRYEKRFEITKDLSSHVNLKASKIVVPQRILRATILWAAVRMKFHMFQSLLDLSKTGYFYRNKIPRKTFVLTNIFHE